MAANYYVVFNRKAYPSDAKAGTAPIASSEVFPPGLESAVYVKIESPAGTVAQAQEIARTAYPGLTTQTPVVVTEAAWKTS